MVVRVCSSKEPVGSQFDSLQEHREFVMRHARGSARVRAGDTEGSLLEVLVVQLQPVAVPL